MNKAEEFKLFIQSIGFVYNGSTISKEYFILDQYEICISYGSSYSMSTYELTEKIQMGVSRQIEGNGSSHHRDDWDVFRTILREKKLKDLGI
jgi:3-hydroxy-3-methylglutaryl CoA synthase